MRATHLILLTVLISLPLACGEEDPPQVCKPGKQEACACPNGSLGAQACKEDGSGYEACACTGGAGAGGAAVEEPKCKMKCDLCESAPCCKGFTCSEIDKTCF